MQFQIETRNKETRTLYSLRIYGRYALFATHLKHRTERYITTISGTKVSAKHVVCTVQLNVLHSITFSPPFPSNKLAASKEGQFNKERKSNCALNPKYQQYSVTQHQSAMLFGFSESDIPTGGPFFVFFR